MSRKIEMALSKDGSYTFTDWRARDLPDYGDYRDPMPCWRRCGISRQFAAAFRITDPVVVNIIALEVQAG